MARRDDAGMPSDCGTAQRLRLPGCRRVALAAALGLAAAARGQGPTVECAGCHGEQADQFKGSVHQGRVRCQQCHGGEGVYELTPEQARQFGIDLNPRQAAGPRPDTFEHGVSFQGKPPRADVPVLCGTCHADVERMNPYGLRTDQLAAYWVSGHGKRLKQAGDERVAVCVDCHGAHDVLRHNDPHARTHFRNIPQTCGRCHSDPALMTEYHLPADIVDQYARSVHGRNVLERGDAGSPNCATCHGSHGAAPPGFAQVGQVCGKCHQQIEEYFSQGVHGKLPGMVRCVGCHAAGGAPHNHEIQEATPPIEKVVEVYTRLAPEGRDGPEPLRARFAEELDQLAGSVRLDGVCVYCHGSARPARGHGSLFERNDQLALEQGTKLAATLRAAQFEYARTAECIARVARGVLLVRDEALRAEDGKTELMALYAFIHTLNESEIQDRAQKLRDICAEIDTALDRKETGLVRRRMALAPVWGLALVFAVLMYRKYQALKHAYVRAPGVAAPAVVAVPSLGRRRLLNAALSALGAAAGLAVVWPAVVYILPARKRGGGVERVSAGKMDGWDPWVARKVSVGGKPVAVIRTGDGFRAFSAICTHLGCIVHWNPAGKEFECPCHAAKFDAAGKVVSGPPPKPLPEFGVSVVQGEVIVTSPVAS